MDCRLFSSVSRHPTYPNSASFIGERGKKAGNKAGEGGKVVWDGDAKRHTLACSTSLYRSNIEVPFSLLSAYLNFILFLWQQIIGSLFIKEQISEYGTNNIYNADTFNEMTSTPNEASYLSGFSNGIYQGMVAGDPNAVWLMQGWLFRRIEFWKPPQVKAFLQGGVCS